MVPLVAPVVLVVREAFAKSGASRGSAPHRICESIRAPIREVVSLERARVCVVKSRQSSGGNQKKWTHGDRVEITDHGPFVNERIIDVSKLVSAFASKSLWPVGQNEPVVPADNTRCSPHPHHIGGDRDPEGRGAIELGGAVDLDGTQTCVEFMRDCGKRRQRSEVALENGVAGLTDPMLKDRFAS